MKVGDKLICKDIHGNGSFTIGKEYIINDIFLSTVSISNDNDENYGFTIYTNSDARFNLWSWFIKPFEIRKNKLKTIL